MQRIAAWLEAWRAAERGRFALWLPVFMGVGVLLYFALRHEPPAWVGVSVAGPAVVVSACLRAKPVLRGMTLAVSTAAIGFAAAQFATATAGPVDALPRKATIVHGTVRGVEELPTGRRLTIAAVRLDGGEAALNHQVRVRLRTNDTTAVASGDLISLRAMVRPPAPPAYPGAWDMQRDAFFADMAGTGYALGPVRVEEHAAGGPMFRVLRLREGINQRIDAALSGATAALAQALLSGVMTAVPLSDMAAFRGSGLAHLLSVSGLHIAIVMGIGVVLVRALLAAWPYAALHWPCKQISALVGLGFGAFYMVLSGSQVPMVRSFIMAGFVAVAMLLGRRALSLRSLAMAAMLLILIGPKSLTGASLQMSFAAVMALLAGHETFGRRLAALNRGHGWQGKVAAYVLGLTLTSVLAGTARLPFGAYHFGQIQFYFAVSNLVAVPLTGVVVMPAGMLGLALMPLGLERPALVVMGWGIDGVLWIAHAVAAWPGATWRVPHMSMWGLLLVSFGMIWLSLWHSRLRLAGVAAILVGLASPAFTHLPDVLVSADASLIAVRMPAGVVAQQVSGASKFTIDAWKHYWAVEDFRPLPAGGDEDGWSCTAEACRLQPLPRRKGVLLVRGATHPDGCRESSVIVSAEPARGLCPRPWPALVDRFTVWRNGATAIWLNGKRAVVLTDRAWRGDRPWVPPIPTPHAKTAPLLAPAPRDTAPAGPAID